LAQIQQQGHELSAIFGLQMAYSRNLLEVVDKEACFFDFEIQNVLVHIHFSLVCGDRKLTLSFEMVSGVDASLMGFHRGGHSF
jgi:hypothetical protein